MLVGTSSPIGLIPSYLQLISALLSSFLSRGKKKGDLDCFLSIIVVDNQTAFSAKCVLPSSSSGFLSVILSSNIDIMIVPNTGD